MKTKNQKIEKHSKVAKCFGRLARDFEARLKQGSSDVLQVAEWKKSATEYREEERRHLLTQKVCGDEFVLIH